MSDVWGVKHRLLLERVDVLHRDMDVIADEEIARLVCAAYVALRQHRVNKRGQCRHCHRPGSWWPRRRKTCTVHQVFAMAMEQPFPVVCAWLRNY
jgi:hypothetical protein